MKRPPIKFIIRIDEDRLSELIYYWNWYDKLCDLLFRKPKTEGLAAVVLTVRSGRLPAESEGEDGSTVVSTG